MSVCAGLGLGALGGLGSLGILGVLALAPAPALAQTPAFDDFRARALEALGGDATTIAFTGRGWDACLGQAWAVTDGWARWELTGYERVIDYDQAISVQRAERRAGLDPERLGGCGAQPDASPAPQQSSIAPSAGFVQQLPIWLTPHGILELAGENGVSIDRFGNGFRLRLEVTEDGTAHRFQALYNDDYLPVTAGTFIDDPIFGDMEVEAGFEDYRSFDGVVFPATLRVNQGGLTQLELSIESVTANVAPPAISPGRGFGGGPGGGEAAYTRIGDGIFAMLGAYQAVAVEFDAFSVVIDGMQNDARTAEIIRLTHEAIPDKPIRYIVNTHSHFDHAAGLRQYAAEGAAIITHGMNVDFFRDALATPRTLNPDRIEPASVEAGFVGVDERYVIEDGSGQRVEVIALEPSPHAADMLIVWLPGIGTVVEADVLQPWINPIFAGDGDGPHPMVRYLHEEIERLGLPVTRFVPVHQPPEPPTMPRAALDDAVGR